METPILTRADFHTDSGRRLRKLIDRLGLTQVDAAALMGVSKHVLRNWLAGDHPIGTYALYRLCRARGVDFNYVFLADWSQLPHRLAQEFEQELRAKLVAASGLERQEIENSEG